MRHDTRQVVRVSVPLVGWPQGNCRAGAFLRPGPDRANEDRPLLKVHPAPAGVEGHWVGDGDGSWWNPFDPEESR